MDAPAVAVEVHLANGLPSFTIVGLAETEVIESKDRVRAALQTAQFDFPARRITVNLAPATPTIPQKRAFILPQNSASEAALVRDAVIYPAQSLLAVCAHLSGLTPIRPLAASTPHPMPSYRDFTEVKAQRQSRKGQIQTNGQTRQG